MKLFVWNNPYPVTYGSSLLIAIAENENQAREVITSSVTFNEFGATNSRHSRGYPADMVAKLGPPLRVVDTPCAELHEWKE